MRQHISKEKNEFTLEIVAHYPDARPKSKLYEHTGSFHAYWEEKDLDLRGIKYMIAKRKDPWIKMPGGKGKIGKESCYFTYISFGDIRKMKRFMAALREAFYIYWRQQKKADL